MAKSQIKELPDGVVKSNLPALFASYPDLNSRTPSSWFAWSADEKKVVAHNKFICHAQILYDGPGYDELITAVPQSDELSLEYLRMLIRGPFRSVSDLIRLERLGDLYYLHCLNLDRWPANVLMNFCIASRVPIEYSMFIKPWAERCETGFDPTLAFLLTYSYGTDYAGLITHRRSFNHWHPNHLWLDAASDWRNILSGEMVKLSKSFKIAPEASRPTNIIWGISKDYEKLCLMTDEEIADFYTIPVQKLERPPPPPPKPSKKLLEPGNYVIPVMNQVNYNPNWVINNLQAPAPQPVDEALNEPEDDDQPDGEWHEAEPDFE